MDTRSSPAVNTRLCCLVLLFSVMGPSSRARQFFELYRELGEVPDGWCGIHHDWMQAQGLGIGLSIILESSLPADTPARN